MKTNFKKLYLSLTAVLSLLVISNSYAGPFQTTPFEKVKLYDQTKVVKDTQTPKSISSQAATVTVSQMKFGWNLGNTMDAALGSPNDGYRGQLNNCGLSTQTCWGQPQTTQAMINFLAENKIKTIRIPTSWHGHFTDKNYTIDPKWMNRVKEIVDWAIAKDMYVILNIHHDNVAPGTLTYGKGYCPNNKDRDESLRFLYNVWCQIATAFNTGYDEHLIFETMNEPRLTNDAHEWNWQENCTTCKMAMERVNEYNQVCLDAIRESAGNNAQRVVMCPSYVASPDCTFKNAFKLPNDPANKLALSVHMYTPYDFAMQSPGKLTFTDAHKGQLDYYFNQLNSKYVSKGIPVVIGEMGATNKNNDTHRKAWFEYFCAGANAKGMCAVLWDNNNYKNKTNPSDYNECYGYFNRSALDWYTGVGDLISTAVNAMPE